MLLTHMPHTSAVCCSRRNRIDKGMYIMVSEWDTSLAAIIALLDHLVSRADNDMDIFFKLLGKLKLLKEGVSDVEHTWHLLRWESSKCRLVLVVCHFHSSSSASVSDFHLYHRNLLPCSATTIPSIFHFPPSISHTVSPLSLSRPDDIRKPQNGRRKNTRAILQKWPVISCSPP